MCGGRLSCCILVAGGVFRQSVGLLGLALTWWLGCDCDCDWVGWDCSCCVCVIGQCIYVLEQMCSSTYVVFLSRGA